MDAQIEKWASSPIDTAQRANKLFLPAGTAPAKRGPKAEYYDTVGAHRITRKQVDERKADAYSAKLVAVLDYYATTTVPFERIAEHTKLSIEQVEAAMTRRGREA